MGYLFAAYSIVWAAVFGFVFLAYRRQVKLHREIELLKGSPDGDNTR
jgi:CcmD family protein